MDTVAIARSLAPAVRERADEIEKARRLPPDLAKRFAREGLCRLLVPEAYGGLEVPPAQMLATVEALAEADGSAAWCVFIYATSGSLLAYLPASEATAVFASPDTILAGVFAPMGKAVAEGDGYRVNGRWSWGSGSENADWIMGGCRIEREGQIEATKSGAPIPRLLLAPRDDVTFFDTWNVSGLCGTGSTDFAMENVFVPAGRAAGLTVDESLARPLYRFPNFALLALGIAGVAMGLARAAIEELVALAGAKTPQGASRSLASRPHTQSEVARSEAALRAARAFLFEVVEEAWSAAQGKDRLPIDARRDLRLATTWATRTSADVVDAMYHLGGGSSVHRTSKLQRVFRDVHVATQHMMVAPPTYELTGRLLLGLETDATFL